MLPSVHSEIERSSIGRWDAVLVLYQQHRGLPRELAMRGYLDLCETLDEFGVEYFDIKNSKGSRMYLGVSSKGISIYNMEARSEPVLTFAWGEISNLSFTEVRASCPGRALLIGALI